ncbi:MAG: hypothetical protein QOE14_217, partial [Humisphaera sp.]|nr:hypothetical protein [Humisphaera sp.]
MPAPRRRSIRSRPHLRLESLESRTLLAGVQLLKDINPKTLFTTTPKNLTDVNGTLFFTAQSKLWRSDGTAAGTVRVTDSVADVQQLTTCGGTLLFASGGRLGKSDGSEAGTVPVSTSYPGPRNIVVAGGRMFFRGSDGGGDELWSSDGTAAGTARIKDIRPGGAGSDIRGLMSINGRVYFRADDGSSGQELWTSDGTAAGTQRVKDINPGVADSGPSFLTNVNGTLYFAATDGASGFELWKSDGTDAGTVRVRDIRAGSGGSTPTMLQNVNGTLMFLANDGPSGFEIWKSDGTPAGTVLVKDIIPGAAGAQINNLSAAGGLLYFSANDGASGYELWKSDGTAAGTVRVKDLAPGATSSMPTMMTPFGERMFFIANNGNSGMEPWISDGTVTGTFLLQDIWPGPNHPNIESAVRVGSDRIFFAVVDEVWLTDGASAGTRTVKPPTGFTLHSSNARNFTNVNGVGYFSADDSVNGPELWRTDGTPSGTSMLLDITPGAGGTDLQQFFNVNGTLFFLANSRLWKSDGTAAGTVMVTTNPLSSPKLIPVGNTLYFIAGTPAGSGLWKSNGTAAGTTLVKANVNAWRPESLVDVNGTLFFTADDGTTGQELWKSDGTAAGTVLVKDIIPGVTSGGPYLLTNVNGTLFFRANDGPHGYELWKSDGTATGTVMVKDIAPGADGAVIQSLRAMNGLLYFTADDRTHGQEIWRSDGTDAGTVLVKDLRPGPHGSSPGNMTVSNGVLYFRADDGVSGAELWKTDGTDAGTVLVKDIVPGPAGSVPSRLVAVNSGVVFDIASSNTIWRSDGSTAGTFNLYPYLMEENFVSMGDWVLTSAWSAGGSEPVKVDATSSAGAPAPAARALSPSSILNPQSSPSPATSSAPATIYDGTFQGDKSNTIAAGMSRMRVVYGDIYSGWMDSSIADESAVRRIAREAFDAGQTIALNVEQWPNDIRVSSESVVGWSAEKMMQIIDWIHDERPGVKVGYAGQVTHGAYLPPARGTPSYNSWHASHERLRPLIDKVDILFPGVYPQDESVNNWLAYAEGHLAEAKLYNKPVTAFLFMNYEGGTNTVGRPVAPEFWRMQLDVAQEQVGSSVVWGPWTDDAPWYEITRDFIAAPDPLLPATATNLAATVNQTTSRITLNWQDKSYNETGFRIERRAAGGGGGAFAEIASLGRNITTWTDIAATPGVDYLYRAIAFSAAGDGAPSSEVAARIRVAPTTPTAVQATPMSGTRNRIQWQSTDTDVDNFIVERSTAGGAFVSIATPPGGQLSYDDNNLSPATRYVYRVRAVNAIGQSPPSAEEAATTLNVIGLLAHWRFDDNPSDVAGNHNGAPAGSPTWTPGTLGDALTFDGVDDRVIVADAADLRFAAADSFTLCAWVNLAALPNRASAIVAKARGSSAPYGLALDATNHWLATGPSNIVGPTATTGWTHVAVVQDAATNTRKLFINGLEVASAAAQAGDGAGALWIGAAETVSEFFAGKIDDVRIYDRALVAAHVAALANPHVALTGTAAADLWTVRLGAAGDVYEFTGPGASFTRPGDAVGSIAITGGDGDDRLFANFDRGQVIAPYGFTFAGGNGIDAIEIIAASAADPFTIDAAAVHHNLGAIDHTSAETIDLTGGTYDVTANLAGERVGARNGATVTFGASQDLADLTIAANARVILAAGDGKVLAVNSLAITNGGALDLSDNDFI